MQSAEGIQLREGGDNVNSETLELYCNGRDTDTVGGMMTRRMQSIFEPRQPYTCCNTHKN